MSSEVDICNLALAQLGDAATVASIRPPEGSAQAGHCARFYPMVRDALLEMHDWGFATKRVELSLLDNPTSQWAYCYACPTDLVNTVAVLDREATDDISVGLAYQDAFGNLVSSGQGVYTPQPFQLESSATGGDVIYTNQANAVLRYIARVTDTTKFSPLFVRTLAAALSSALAGPVLKGDAGISASLKWQAVAFGADGKSGIFGLAAASDAGQKRTTPRDRQQPGWAR